LPDYPHTDHIPAPTLVEYDVGDNPLRDQVLTRPLRPVNGRIAVPEAPGLGIDLDRDALQRFRVD
jgi:D-galactarolactone cycloisomerase